MFKGSSDEQVFTIAEVGQNHQGDIDSALEYIRIFAFEGADAIKFQTRNNKYLFDDASYYSPYDSENAFAETYGAHREALELSVEEIKLVKAACEDCGVKFMSTPFDEPSLELLAELGTEVLKVASFDIGNIPFLSKIAETGIPTAMSVGGANADQIANSVAVFEAAGTELALLHCVSEYPCPHDRLGLENISVLRDRYSFPTIGSSDHFNGTLSGPVAYMLGARVFEKHVTLNRAWKGTDHSFALEPEGFRKFVRDIKRVSAMLPVKSDSDLGNEAVFQKLGKSICASTEILKGDRFTIENLTGKIFKTAGIPVRESADLIGKIAEKDIAAGAQVLYDDF